MQLLVAQLPAINAILPASELQRFSRSCERALKLIFKPNYLKMEYDWLVVDFCPVLDLFKNNTI